MRKLLLILVILIQGISLLSQQQPIFSQFMMNKYLYNPAVAGSDGYTSIYLTSRNQWVGIDKAPQTYNLSFQTRLLKRPGSVTKKSTGKNSAVSARDGRGRAWLLCLQRQIWKY